MKLSMEKTTEKMCFSVYGWGRRKTLPSQNNAKIDLKKKQKCSF